MRTRGRRWVAAVAATGALFALPACASSVDPIERLGRKAAERVTTRPTPAREVRAAVDAKECGGLRERTPITPQGDELALRLTEC
ncbi:hypothetical protein [Streptomyces sp. NPDC058872]|uniref:hypothetical protein n=1 Tax=Streptomyces sp. NPDC058872 TaxID=3346661 RepID=UPI0036B4E382